MIVLAAVASGTPGLASLALLNSERAYAKLAATTTALADGLHDAARHAGYEDVQITTAPGLLTVFFSAQPVTDYAGAQACDLAAHAVWCRGLLARGVYPPPSQFEAWFPSLAHTPRHVERTVAAAAGAFEELTR